MLNKQYLIIETFTHKPWKALTFREIRKLSNNKSDNYVHSALKDFVKKKILKEERIGNSILYSVKNEIHALNTIGYVLEYKANASKHIPHKNIQSLIEKIKTPFYSILITGSYAKGIQTKNSDLDLVIICENETSSKKILAEIKMAGGLMIPEVHPYVFTYSQFYQMLVDEKENYGKETARNNFVVTGAKQYYSILMKAVKNGFNG